MRKSAEWYLHLPEKEVNRTLWPIALGLLEANSYTRLQIRAGQRSITANLWPLTSHIYHVMVILTGGFFKKSFLIIIFRSSRTQMFFKTGVIRNFTIFAWKRLRWSLFLVRLQAFWPATLFQPRLKRDFNTGDSCEKNVKFLWTTFFMEHLRWLLLSVW